MKAPLGRARECAELDDAVAAARKGKGGSLIITGGPGAGKSELLDYVANSAGDAEIIRIEGLESEAAIGLAGLHRLLLFYPDGRDVLPPAQRRALDASLGVGGSDTEASPFLLGLAVLTLVDDLSGSRLLVCLIDDAHWLDAESAQVLAFVARRCCCLICHT
jgi:AAA ATPase domain